MRLWSYQGVGHSLTDGHIDPSRLPYLETVPRYADAIKELAKRVGEPSGQFIWCLTRDTEWLIKRIAGTTSNEALLAGL